MRAGVLTCTLLTAFAAAGSAGAQAVRGIGDDATTAARGMIRVQLSTTITDMSQRYGKGTPGRRDGALEPLHADFWVDTLGVAQFPGLAAVQGALRSLTGNAGFTLDLGRTSLNSSVRVQTTPILLEAGITSRITLGVMVPLVSARTQAQLNVNGGTGTGNAGFNLARLTDSAVTTNARVIAALDSARVRFAARFASCTAAPAASGCADVLSTGEELRGGLATFVQNLTSVYGTTRAEGAVVVPLAGTPADSIILGRIEQYRTRLNLFGTGPGAVALTPSRPVARVTQQGLQRVITDSTLALAAAPLGTVTRQGIGDIEVSVKVKLFDAFGGRRDTLRFRPVGLALRQSIAGVYRFATGTIDDPANYLDIGTGAGTAAVEARSFTDVMYGRRFFASVIARYSVPMQDQQSLRITDTPDQVFAPAWRQRLVSRTLGSQLHVELTPRWMLNDFFSAGAQYLFRRKAEDRFSGTYTVTTAESGLAAPVTLDAQTLSLETSAQEHRMGVGLTFSTVAAHARRRAFLPLELQYFTSRTIAGSGGAVPKLSIHQVQVRLYPQF